MTQMQNMKIRIHSEEHSREVQEKLFEMGYAWSHDTKEVLHTTHRHLYAWDSGCICYEDDEDYFVEAGKYIEYVLHGGSFIRHDAIPTERPPLGLRPKSVVDSLRIKEILEACTRYAEAGKKIPGEWLVELTTLNLVMKD